MIDTPLTLPNWPTHPTDQQIAVATMKRGCEFSYTSAIAPILIGKELLPGQDIPVGSTGEEILSYVQKILGSTGMLVVRARWAGTMTRWQSQIPKPQCLG